MTPPISVVLLHNRYRERGGEERAVAEQATLLRARGHEVRLLERSSEQLGRARAAGALLRGGEDSAEVSRVVAELSGEVVVHAHNLHPLFGFRALRAAREAGARTVLQLHNFRLFCAIGVAYRDGGVCHRCRGRDTLPGLRLRCRGSVGEAAVYAAALARQQPRLVELADRLIVLSEATREVFGQLGLPLERCDVIANPLPEDAFAPASRADAGGYALCAGRLVEEKGFDVAVRAARAAGVPLRIAGSGPDFERLRALADGDSLVELLGAVSAERMAALRAEAAVLLAPSRCEEQSPYSVLEAMAAGVPVLVSSLGGLPELAGREAVLDARDAGAWGRALAALWADGGERRRRGEAALVRARERASGDAVYGALMEVYARAGAAAGV